MKISGFPSFPWIVAVLVLGCLPARASDAPWLTDYQQALGQAKAEKKDVLMDFTGSDWCPWCIRMDKEVLSTGEFKSYAGKNLVLMLVDFPQSTQLPQKVQDQNNTLQQKYGAEGFPTFILVDSDGNVLGKQVGYLEGGPTAFIAKIESMRK
jgi:thioredoxin-related protein